MPNFRVFKFSKPKFKPFLRHIWRYEYGDYNLLRQKASSIDWDSLQDDDVNKYANNLNITINTVAGECIPNKQIRVKPFELPWITCVLLKDIYGNEKELIKRLKEQT